MAKSTEPLTIRKFQARNIKRITVVNITPDGDLVKITGKNGQGKTSILDSIAMAFGGKSAIPPEPLKRGAKDGEILVDVGQFIIRRRFTDDGKTALQVTEADGTPISGPQTFMDSIVGRIAFDPIQFSKMPAKDQADQLRKLAGLDLTDLEKRRAKLYADRTLVNRDYETARAKLRGMEAPEAGLPDAELVVADLVAERDQRHKAVQRNIERRRTLQGDQENIASLTIEIQTLESRLDSLKRQRADLQKHVEAEVGAIAMLLDPDLSSIDAQIRDSHSINAKVRNRQAWQAGEAEVKRFGDASDALSIDIKAIDEEKELRISQAKFPIPGLGFNDEGLVTLKGLPLEQASQAERLRACVAIGLAANPTLRVLLIRDGNDLDADNLAVVAQMAHEAGAQVWLEKVSNAPGDEPDGIYIEDGMVRPAPARELQEA